MRQFRQFRLLKGVVVGVLLFQFALMILMASSAKAHGALHCDADHHDHSCEVTLFQQGLLDSGPGIFHPPVAPIGWERPRNDAPADCVDVTPSHLIGGQLAQGPTRAP